MAVADGRERPPAEPEPERRGTRLNRTDQLLAVYLVFLTTVIIFRGPFGEGRAWLLASHLLFALLLALLAALRGSERVGETLHDFYPIVLLPVFYAEIGILNGAVGLQTIMANDAVLQHWEAAIFGGQVSYEWIRNAPSTFWSGLLHLAYLVYYPIVVLGALVLAFHGFREGARRTVFAMMLAFVACYVGFVLYPVAGPNHAFPHPTGPVRDVWSAKLVYAALARGSSIGAAFPSSHVAATVAVTIAVSRVWRPLGVALVGPALLLLVGTVYCQMHYAVDAASGLAVGVAAGYFARRLWRERSPTVVESDRSISSSDPRIMRR